jgi:hypothetical protein
MIALKKLGKGQKFTGTDISDFFGEYTGQRIEYYRR